MRGHMPLLVKELRRLVAHDPVAHEQVLQGFVALLLVRGALPSSTFPAMRWGPAADHRHSTVVFGWSKLRSAG